MPVIDDIRDSQKMLKGKGFKYKVQYFWEYYRVPVINILAFVAIAISVITTMIKNKPAQFSVAWVNAVGLPDSASFADYAGIDESNGIVSFDSGYLISTDPLNITEATYTSSQKLMASIAGGTLDTMICTEDLVQGYLNSELYEDLRVIYSDAELKALGDKVLWGTPTNPETGEVLGEEMPYAICIGSASAITSVPCYFDEDVYVAVIANAPHKDMVKQFVDFLFEYKAQ